VNATPAIRQANLNDLPKIKEVIDLSFPRFYRYFASHSASDLSEPTLISEVENEVAGFAKLIEFNIGDVKYGCILWIAVHPTYRHRGIALTLTNASVDYLKENGSKAVFASTQRRNRGALATLSRAGFVRMGFLGLWRVFGWRVFEFYRDIWFAPGEVVYARLN
jgi:ribosomal protein S18 acetylase RimI-like enzyme